MRILYFSIIFLYSTISGLAYWLLFTPIGAQWVVRQAVVKTLGAQAVTWQKLSGSLVKGVQLEQLEARSIPYLPLASFVRVQSLAVRLTELSLKGFDVEIINARLFMVDDESIVMNASLVGGELAGNIYTRGLALGSMREILMQYFAVPYFQGSVRDIDLFVRGTLDRPEVKGDFYVERIMRSDIALSEAPVKVDLHFVKGRYRWETHGKLLLTRGVIRNPYLRMTLKSSQVNFTGRPAYPELDIRAVAKVKRTQIDIKIRGSRQAPRVDISSDPPYPREQILLMLATGKRWSGVESDLSGNAKLSPALTSNIVGYFLFGGERSKIIKALGLSDISLNADDKSRGVTFSKDLTDRLGVGYGLEMGTDTQSQRAVSQRLLGEYYFTDKFSLGAQKELKPYHDSATAGTATDPATGAGMSSADIADDRVFLKFRSSF